nr:uncharacterized protein LOC107415127 isoform X2 [Ziziphus jujuba var. spinosa]
MFRVLLSSREFWWFALRIRYRIFSACAVQLDDGFFYITIANELCQCPWDVEMDDLQANQLNSVSCSFCQNLPRWLFIKSDKAKAISVLCKIYEFPRLEDEIAYLSSQLEDLQQKEEVSYWDVFRRTDIRLAFLANVRLQKCVSAIHRYQCS